MINYSAPPEKEQIHQPADQMPYWAIGRMLMTDGTHWFVGTGSLIQPQYVLTAAHVVHGKTAGTITFGYDVNDNDGNPGRTVPIARAAIPTKYGQQGWDIAVAQLAAPYKKTADWFFNPQGSGTDRSAALQAAKSNQGITLAGYPGAGPVTPSEHPQVALGHMYGKNGPVTVDFGKNLVQYSFDTRGGESGSPLYWPAKNQIIGVHTNWAVAHDKQVGQGTLITDEVLQWIAAAIQSLATIASPHFVRQV